MQAILKHLLEEKFGLKILPPINGTMNGAGGETFSTRQRTIEKLDAVTGLVFEKIIAELFDAMENFSAEKTPDTNEQRDVASGWYALRHYETLGRQGRRPPAY